MSEWHAHGLLGVHVLGPGYGESIVLELPDGTVGVIDVFRDPQKALPVADFLDRHLNGCTLRFIALTHPHADHCNGISDFMTRFEAEEFFVFDSFQEENLFRFFRLMSKHQRRDVIEEALNLPAGTVADQLARLNHHLEGWLRGRSSRVRRLLSRRSRRLCEGTVTLRFLTPGDHQSGRYKSTLNQSVRLAVGDDLRLREDWQPSALNHNLVSGSILVQYGKPT